MSATLLRSFLLAVGDRMCSVIEVTGPTSYTTVTAGTPPAGPTGGQSVPASTFGLKFIEEVIGGLDESGTYNVLATPGPNKDATSVTLMWITAHTGAELASGDIHTYTARIMAFGR